MTVTVTARSIIDEARAQDARFFETPVADGALVVRLNTRQRHLLLLYGSSVEGLLDQSQQIAAQVNGSLVGITTGGTPYFITTVGNGYPTQFTSSGVPYVNPLGTPISLDPFGVNGGTPGFPLPPDCIKFVMVAGSFADGATTDIDIIPERSRNYTNTHNPSVFVNGNRLVPIHSGSPPLSGIYQDVWASITAVTVSYIGMTTLSTLDDLLTIPTVLHAALVADIAELLARNTKECSIADRQLYIANNQAASQAMAMAGIDVLGDVMQNSILYRE